MSVALPLTPDPELIDNAEGNQRILKQDRASAEAYVRERSGKHISYLVECQTMSCKNFGKQWRIWPTKVMPGLISHPRLACDECLRYVVRVEDSLDVN